MSRKQQFRLYITLFCTFLCRLFTTTTLKCLISRLMENVNKKRRNFIFLLEPGYGPLEFNFKRILLQSKWVEIIAIKNERTQIHFLQRRSRCCCVAGSRTMHYACFYSQKIVGAVCIRKKTIIRSLVKIEGSCITGLTIDYSHRGKTHYLSSGTFNWCHRLLAFARSRNLSPEISGQLSI